MFIMQKCKKKIEVILLLCQVSSMTPLDLPHKFYALLALAHELGRIPDPAEALLGSLINRLSPSDRPRPRTLLDSCH